MWGDGVGVHFFLYLEDGNIIVNFSAMLLGNTFGNPHNVTALLFLEFQVRIEYTKVELLHEGVHVQFDLKMLEYVFSFSALNCFQQQMCAYLMFEEFIFQCLITRIIS